MVSSTESLQAPGAGQQFFPTREGFVYPDSMWNVPYTSTSVSPTIGHRRAIVKSDSSNHLRQSPAGNQHNPYTAHQPFPGHYRLPFWGYGPAPTSQLSQQSPTNSHTWSSSPVVGSGRIVSDKQRQVSPISPPPGLALPHSLPEQNNNSSLNFHTPDGDFHSQPSQSYPSINDIAAELGKIQVSPVSSPPASLSPWSTGVVEQDDDFSDSDEDESPSHPNKYPVEIEYHDNKFCSYKRQATKSGEKVKQKLVTTYDPITLEPQTSLQQSKHYQKHLVRICRCGKYEVMDGALQQGRSNDCNGYEIHYSQKCRWKAYDDFKTGKRVLIRLCKCYKPA